MKREEEVPALVKAEELEDLGNGIPEAAACPLARLSQQRLEPWQKPTRWD
jgi:hypothetical protein